MSDYDTLCSLTSDAAETDEERRAFWEFQRSVSTIAWLEVDIEKQRDQYNKNVSNAELLENHMHSVLKRERQIEAANQQIQNLLKTKELQKILDRECSGTRVFISASLPG